jgi:8-oxo-dGTP pyrophosphatase MutT (NUDIX family)
LAIPLPYKYRGGGVAVFRKNNGKTEVLLGLRRNNPGKGKWSFPGGEAEGKEKLITAGTREFREETGVQLLGRYITKAGVYRIESFLFDWETQVIETTQNIDPKAAGFRSLSGKDGKIYDGEFTKLEWVAIESLDTMRLHRWVREAADVYLSGQMKPYKAKDPKERAVYPARTNRISRVKNVPSESGASLLFDMSEMVLTKVGRDGTKYFQPKYQVSGKKAPVIQEAMYGI